MTPEGHNEPGGRSAGAPDNDDDGVPNSRDEFPEDPEYFALVDSVQETIILEADHYKAYKISPERLADIIYSAETMDGTRIDMFVTDETNIKKLQEHDRWRYYEEGSVLSTESASVSMTVGTDRTYYIVFDNSDAARATPSTANGEPSTKVKINLKVKLRSGPVGN